MPIERLVSMTFAISKVRPSRIRLRTAGCTAGSRRRGHALVSVRRNSVWEMTACSVLASMARIWSAARRGTYR